MSNLYIKSNMTPRLLLLSICLASLLPLTACQNKPDRISELENRMSDVESENDSLKSRVDDLESSLSDLDGRVEELENQ